MIAKIWGFFESDAMNIPRPVAVKYEILRIAVIDQKW